MIKELREQTGAGVMDCRSALIEAEGDTQKALKILEQRNVLQAQKKAERKATQGIVEAYIHTGGRIGAMVEVNCETDFVARTDEFKKLAHNLAMQIAAQDPQFISKDQMPDPTTALANIACLLLQSYIKDPEKSVGDIITETIAKVGENIKVSRFARFELGG
jgi:elongation factor Ts